MNTYAYFEDKEKRQDRSRSDYGLDFGFLYRKHVITDGFRAGIRVVPGRQHNGQHLVWKHMHSWWQVSRTSVQLGETNGNDTHGP